jgi:hypothetical protein
MPTINADAPREPDIKVETAPAEPTSQSSLRELLALPQDFASPQKTSFERDVFNKIDIGPLLAKHIARRLVNHFSIEKFVSFTHGISVALNPILFRHSSFQAYLPERFHKQAPFKDIDWIHPYADFTPEARTMLHWHPFCSNIDTAREFLGKHAAGLTSQKLVVAISDCPTFETGELVRVWANGKGGVIQHWYSVASGLTCVLEDVQASDVAELFEILAQGQRGDRMYRKFAVGQQTNSETPTDEDIKNIGRHAQQQIRAAALGIAIRQNASTTVRALTIFADRICRPEQNDGNTVLSWISDHLSRAKPAAAKVEAINATKWQTYFVLYCAANYAHGLRGFDDEPSETIDLLRSGKLAWKDVNPRPCYAAGSYDIHYNYDDHIRSGIPLDTIIPAPQLPAAPAGNRPGHIPLPMKQPNGHHARLQFVVGHIKYLAALLLAERGLDVPFRWLDVGCGSGAIANSIDFKELGIKNYEVLGVDLGENKIAHANRNCAHNRTFMHQDLRTLPPEVLASGFDLVTAFEVTEHLRDPAGFFKVCASVTRNFVMFGSPLEEPCQPFPSEAHTFSFTTAGFENLVLNAGLDIQSSNALRVGKYKAGHDWLTIVGRTKETEKK